MAAYNVTTITIERALIGGRDVCIAAATVHHDDSDGRTNNCTGMTRRTAVLAESGGFAAAAARCVGELFSDMDAAGIGLEPTQPGALGVTSEEAAHGR